METDLPKSESARMRDMPEDERPREKLEKLGIRSLSDPELLAIFLGTGTKGINAVQVGRELIRKYGSLGGLARCSQKELSLIKGIGRVKALHLMAAFDVGRRVVAEKYNSVPLDTPENVFELVGQEMQAFHEEHLRVLIVDVRLRLKRSIDVSRGSLSETIAHPREILRHALLENAHGFVLVHNHPSGDPSPSRADYAITTRLKEATALMQMNFLDHIIIGRPQDGAAPYYSFRENGIL